MQRIEKLKEILKNICISALALLLLLVFLEGVFSLLAIGDITRFNGFGYTPSCCADIRPDLDVHVGILHDHPYTLRTNNLGFRNSYPISEESEGFRILAVGDSFTFGPYLSNDETYTAYLEGLFGDDTQILNAGVSGSTIVFQEEYLREKGVRVHPDVVLLQFLSNDITDVAKQDIRSYTPLISSVVNVARDRSHVFAALFGSVVDARIKHQSDELQEQLGANADIIYNESDHPYYDRYEESFVNTVEFLRSQNISVVVVVFPTYKEIVDASLDTPAVFMKNLCLKHSVECLDLHDAFSQEDPEVMYLVPWNTHLSKHGNQLAAKHIYTFLEEQSIHGE